jgi:uncharacterized membrane protein (DUF373 family)
MSARWKHLRENWAVHSYYQRFESSVALVLTLIIALIVLVALYRLAANVTAALLLGVFDSLDHKVLLIALLALARKFIILDLKEVSADQLLGLAAVTLVLGVTYWLLRERDERVTSRP